MANPHHERTLKQNFPLTESSESLRWQEAWKLFWFKAGISNPGRDTQIFIITLPHFVHIRAGLATLGTTDAVWCRHRIQQRSARCSPPHRQRHPQENPQRAFSHLLGFVSYRGQKVKRRENKNERKLRVSFHAFFIVWFYFWWLSGGHGGTIF